MFDRRLVSTAKVFAWLHRIGAGLLLTAVPVLALAAGLSPEERLEALRNGLTHQSLQGSTQVQTASWIDAQGALREASSFRTGMQVRGVRVLSYARDEQGVPQARLQVESSQDLLKPQSARTDVGACRLKDKLQHVLGLQMQVLGRWSVDETHLLRDAIAVLGQSWREAPWRATRWQLVELPALPAQPSRTSAEAYERVLTGGSALSPAVPWQLLIALETIPAVAEHKWLPWSSSTPVRVRLSLLLQSPREKSPALQRASELTFETHVDNWAAPRLSAASREQLREMVQVWSKAVTERLACEPVQVQVLQAGSDRLQIDQGALAGVQAGDEWLVSDRRRWPSRMLEKDSAASLVLARVERVSDHQAQLQVLAGPAAAVKPRWQAWPVESP